MTIHFLKTILVWLTASVTCVCCFERSPAAETNFSADITVKLAKPHFGETEVIGGKIHLKIVPGNPPTVPGSRDGLDVCPTLHLFFDSELAAVPFELVINGLLDRSVLAGREVEVPFEIKMSPQFGERLRNVGPVAKFRPGQHHCYAVLKTFASYGPPASPWNTMIPTVNWSPTIGATQHFEIVATGARSVTSQELIQLTRGASDSLRTTIASFFSDRDQLTASDLLPIMEDAKPDTKGRLAQLYLRRGGAAKHLTFFERPKERVVLDVHTNKPFFLRLLPREDVRFVYSEMPAVTHNVNGLEHNYVIISKSDQVSRAPAQTGLYRVVCDIHATTWCWVLVVDDEKPAHKQTR